MHMMARMNVSFVYEAAWPEAWTDQNVSNDMGGLCTLRIRSSDKNENIYPGCIFSVIAHRRAKREPTHILERL